MNISKKKAGFHRSLQTTNSVHILKQKYKTL